MSARQLTIGKLNAAKQATIKKGTGKIAAFKHYMEKVNGKHPALSFPLSGIILYRKYDRPHRRGRGGYIHGR